MKKMVFYILILISAAMLAWSVLIEPFRLQTRNYHVTIDKLPPLKIVFISDFHVAPKQRWYLQKIIRQVNRLHPDYIFLGGDFVKGHRRESTLSVSEIASELANLKARYGIFAVLGNHDWWYGGEDIRSALSAQHIHVLENEYLQLHVGARKLYLSGLADMETRSPDYSAASIPLARPLIILSHSPDVLPHIPQQADLVLAGHTHGGQVNLPFFGAPVVPSAYGQRYAAGMVRENNQTMIVSRGLGTSILPLRFNCQPEVSVIRIN